MVAKKKKIGMERAVGTRGSVEQVVRWKKQARLEGLETQFSEWLRRALDGRCEEYERFRNFESSQKYRDFLAWEKKHKKS